METRQTTTMGQYLRPVYLNYQLPQLWRSARLLLVADVVDDVHNCIPSTWFPLENQLADDFRMLTEVFFGHQPQKWARLFVLQATQWSVTLGFHLVCQRGFVWIVSIRRMQPMHFVIILLGHHNGRPFTWPTEIAILTGDLFDLLISSSILCFVGPILWLVFESVRLVILNSVPFRILLISLNILWIWFVY